MKVAIIGGSGKMGRWFARLLRGEGREVVLSGRDRDKLREAGDELGVEVASNVEAAKSADVVILSVSPDSFEEVVREIGPHTSPGQIVMDITSVKVVPVAAMHKYIRAGRVLGAHPLFGPGAGSLESQSFILTPTNQEEGELAGKIQGYLESRGAAVSLMSPQEHDDIMAIVLGLAHFIAIVSADTLINSDRMKQAEQFGGTTYKVLLTLAESVLTEDPGLYASLQTNLPGAAGIEKQFQKVAGEWADLVANKDRTEFARRMQYLKDKLERISPDFGRSYQDMYRIAGMRR